MSYFSNLYDSIKYPVKNGLRKAQLGAIHSIASYFTIENDQPGIVVMPTGSGKTVVLMMSPFVLQSNRVLIITPSKLVRGQIFEDFSQLKKLKELNVLDKNVATPKIKQVFSPIKNSKEWNILKDFDIVIGTPNCLSQGHSKIPTAPKDLFDLIIFDESHHFGAKTWRAIYENFKGQRHLFFTATPFRRDKKEIAGKFIYTYPLSLAYKDNIFGNIEFVPVKENSKIDIDTSIANKVEEIYNLDKSKGLEHKIIIRTDSKKRGKEIEELYSNVTNLKIKKVDSDDSLLKVKSAVEDLKVGNLDGIICVNMFGEGFDFPNLKIAGIHTPHKSLEVTLQFIGRFARTTAQNIGTAKFIGSINDIEHEGKRLYDEDVNWNNIISNLNDLKLFEESYIKETIDKFSKPTIVKNKFENLSFSALCPYFHVKIFRLTEHIDIKKLLKLPGNYVIEYQNYSKDLEVSVYIISETKEVKWVKLERYDYEIYDLIVIYFDPISKLLIINSSKKDKTIYENIVTSYTKKYFETISAAEINKVLKNIENPKFFNIGLADKTGTRGESYRTISGSTADKSITSTDINMYNRGHAMGRGREDGKQVTIGFSKNSKVWSSTIDNIPKLLKWIGNIVEKINDNKKPKTGTNLDLINTTERITKIPGHIVSINWNNKAFDKFYTVFPESDMTKTFELKDIEITVDEHSISTSGLEFVCSYKQGRINVNTRYSYSISKAKMFTKVNSNEDEIIIILGEKNVNLVDFLNIYPMAIYTSNFEILEGRDLSKYQPNYNVNLNDFCYIQPWAQKNVDIQKEIKTKKAGKISIHDYFKNSLNLQSNNVVIYDHGTGEIADFITIKDSKDEIDIHLFHCKGSGTSKAGSRVNDIYEIVGQGIKSLSWIKNQDKLLDKINDRIKINKKKIIKGSEADMKKLLRQTALFNKPYKFTIHLVQPGLSKKKIKDNTALPIVAAYDFFKTNNNVGYVLHCSD